MLLLQLNNYVTNKENKINRKITPKPAPKINEIIIFIAYSKLVLKLDGRLRGMLRNFKEPNRTKRFAYKRYNKKDVREITNTIMGYRVQNEYRQNQVLAGSNVWPSIRKRLPYSIKYLGKIKLLNRVVLGKLGTIFLNFLKESANELVQWVNKKYSDVK